MKTIAIIIISFLLITMFVGFTSCSESKKITKAKATLLSHPAHAADFCADNFGCPTISIDSSGEVAAKRTADSLLNELEKERVKENPEMDLLKAEINRLAGIAPQDCDSLSDAIYRYAAKEKARADRAEEAARQLRNNISNQKPRIEYIKDPAREKQLENSNQLKLVQIEHRDKQIIDLDNKLSKTKRLKNWWMIACIITWLFIVGAGVLKFKRII